MTDDRLNEILDEQKIVRYRQHFLKAMKQAVNEAIQECADGLTGVGSVERGLDMAFKHHKEINRKRILNLKVK